MTDHDRLYKELLTTFIKEFILLFLSSIAPYIDFETLEPLDKEVFTDVTAGEKHEADIVMKVKFKEGYKPPQPETQAQTNQKRKKRKKPKQENAYFLIHIENQSSSRADFNKRMFIYVSRLIEKYGYDVYPIAVFSYKTPDTLEPDEFRVAFPDLEVIQFRYKVIQLNQLDWQDFLNRPNPVASALMATMKIKKEDEPIVKAQCVAMMVGLQLDDARSKMITGFVDSYLRLNAAQEKIFEAELDKLIPPEAKEKVMEVLTSHEQRGIAKGKREGKREGEITIIVNQLNHRFGQLLPDVEERVSKLPQAALEALSRDLFDFSSVVDLQSWLEQHK